MRRKKQKNLVRYTLLLRHAADNDYALGSEGGTSGSVTASSIATTGKSQEDDHPQQVCYMYIYTYTAYSFLLLMFLQSIMKKRIVQVKQVQLHMTHKHLPPEDSSFSQAFFFLRTTPDPIPFPSSPQDATATLACCFEMGTIDCGHPLQALSKTLSHLYAPMLMIAGNNKCI